jgi:nitrite reductase/ring-hydroxylating ferredoxin subunit
MREIFVAREQEISDGERKIVIDDKVEIGVFRIDGAFYAWRNDCPHQGGPVCQGRTST